MPAPPACAFRWRPLGQKKVGEYGQARGVTIVVRRRYGKWTWRIAAAGGALASNTSYPTFETAKAAAIAALAGLALTPAFTTTIH
jgi:hypothetical protein